MYFFNSVLPILFIVLGTFYIYKYLRKKTPIAKDTLLVVYICLLESIFLLYSNNLIFLIFLDLAPFLGYLINRRKEAFILFLTTSIYTTYILNLPVFFLIMYITFISLILVFSKTSENKSIYLLFIKVFVTAFLYFYYIDTTLISILEMLAIFIYFHILLEFIYNFLKSNNSLSKEENIIFQVAHEVKNPIAVCKGYLDMLDVNDPEKVKKYIPIIKKEMNRSLTIMDEFLDLKRLSLKKELMDFSLLLEDIDDTMKIIFKDKDITLEIPKIDEEIILDGDYDKLKQVIINLIKNSYEADANKIKISLKYSSSHVTIKVKDNGIGMSERDLKKIGQVFFTTKVTGTGIGVSMSKEIVKLHNGKLLYESKLNKGTTATLILPISYAF